jgi:hypothetical protein
MLAPPTHTLPTSAEGLAGHRTAVIRGGPSDSDGHFSSTQGSGDAAQSQIWVKARLEHTRQERSSGR